jgi:hypothetical protein
MGEYEAQNSKPRFKNPGYPNFKALSDQCNTKDQYEEGVERFLDRHSIKKSLNNYDKDCANYVIPKVSAQNPGIAPQGVRDFVKGEQEKQYDQEPYRDPEHQSYPKVEVD